MVVGIAVILVATRAIETEEAVLHHAPGMVQFPGVCIVVTADKWLITTDVNISSLRPPILDAMAFANSLYNLTSSTLSPHFKAVTRDILGNVISNQTT